MGETVDAKHVPHRNESAGHGQPIAYDKRYLTVSPPVEALTVDAINEQVGYVDTEIPETVFTSSTSGVTFTWTNDNPSIGPPTSGTGNQPAFTILHTGTSQTYTIKVSSCVLPVNPHLMGRFRGDGL
jgi:hypothetical protein